MKEKRLNKKNSRGFFVGIFLLALICYAVIEEVSVAMPSLSSVIAWSNSATLPKSAEYKTDHSRHSYDVLETEDAKEIYRKIEKAAYYKPDSDRMLCRFDDVDDTQFCLAYKAFLEDNPDVFWLTIGTIRSTSGIIESQEHLERKRECRVCKERKDRLAGLVHRAWT